MKYVFHLEDMNGVKVGVRHELTVREADGVGLHIFLTDVIAKFLDRTSYCITRIDVIETDEDLDEELEDLDEDEFEDEDEEVM